MTDFRSVGRDEFARMVRAGFLPAVTAVIKEDKADAAKWLRFLYVLHVSRRARKMGRWRGFNPTLPQLWPPLPIKQQRP